MLGRFDYPVIDKDDKSSKYSLKDSDSVFLGQRKNQLSRRLREAKSIIDIPDIIEESPNITHHYHKDDHDENNSINTNTSLNPCNMRNDPLLKKSIDIFDSNMNNFLLSIMTKSDYSPDMITD